MPARTTTPVMLAAAIAASATLASCSSSNDNGNTTSASNASTASIPRQGRTSPPTRHHRPRHRRTAQRHPNGPRTRPRNVRPQHHLHAPDNRHP